MNNAALRVTPVAAASLPEGWIEERRELIRARGQAVRAGAGAAIEIKSLTPREQLAAWDPMQTNEWCLLVLPGGAVEFQSVAERDAVVAELVGARAPAGVSL